MVNQPDEDAGCDAAVIHVLLVEDNPFEAQQLKAALAGCLLKTSVTWAQRVQSALDALASNSFDALLLDLALLQQMGSKETLAVLRRSAQATPILILCKKEEREAAIDCMQFGVQDYLLKAQYDSEILGKALRYAIERAKSEELMRRTIIERKMDADNMRKMAILEQREQFASLLAHDLKTPLIGSERVLSMLLAGSVGHLSAAQVDLLGKMRSNNQAVLLMIENLLDAYRTDVQTLEFRRVQISNLVNDCVQEMRPLSNHKRLKVLWNVPDHLRAVVDEAAIKRVVNNILSNAIKFTPDGGRIEIVAGEKEGSVSLTISDTGIGMSKEQVDTLFQRVWQEQAGYGKGLGLGLLLAYKLIEAHNGSISCKSEPGAGSSFEIILPKSPMAHVKSKLGVNQSVENVINFNA